MTGQDLGGLILTPGTYCFDSSSQLTGNLILNDLGDPNAIWIFRMGSTLTTASNSTVQDINRSQRLCNVFWQVGSSATLGTDTQFMGNILAVASVTLNTGAGLLGRAVARTAAVTLDKNAVTPVFCALAQTATPANTNTPTATTLPASPTSTSTATPTNANTPTATILPASPTRTLTATLANTNTPTATIAPGAPTWTPTTTMANTNTPTATISRTPTTTAANTSTPTSTLLTGGSPMTPTTTQLAATLLAGVAGLPNSGGAPIRDEGFPWSLIIAGGIGVMTLILGVHAHRRMHKPTQ